MIHRIFTTISIAFICAALFAPRDASAVTEIASVPKVQSINVSGNKRIEAGTIETYLGLKQGSDARAADLNNALKTLYDTGFFQDIRLSFDDSNGQLNVGVLENASINKVVFEGNNKLDDETLEKEVSLRARSIYTKSKVQSDVERLLEVYRRSGRYSAKVEPKIIQLPQNRITLVYEISEGPITRVENIDFIGNKAFDSPTLAQVILTEENIWYRFISDNDIYDPDRLAYDQELLRKFYRSQGYADFDVTSAIAELSPEKDAFYLTLTVEEGPKYSFNNVTIESSLSGTVTETITPLLTTDSKDTYDADEIESSIQAIVEELGNQGFAFVDVDPKTSRNPDNKTIDLTYLISEGPRVYIERIDIEGNARTLDEVIRREFRLVEGDPYSTAKLRRTEQRLRNLGFFESIKIDTIEGSAKDRVIVKTVVQEQSTGEINIGAGFSTNDGPLLEFGISERNLLGRGQTLRLNTTLAERAQQFDLGFTEPYFLDRDVSAGFDLFKSTQDFSSESSFDRDTIGGRMRLGYSLGEKLRHNLRYTLQENTIEDVDDNASRFIRDQEGSALSSVFGHSFVYDNRDNRFAPNEGAYWRINQDVAGLIGDDYFLRNEILAEYYIPLAEQVTLGFAAAGGHIIPLGEDIRINQRFFVGGRRLRGFDNSGIGPRDITTSDALGGNAYYIASSEMLFPLGLPNEVGMRGAFFIDAGSLWDVDDTGADVADDNSVRLSIGAGIAWASPFGPIRLDFGFPILKEEYDEEETFRFSFGTRF